MRCQKITALAFILFFLVPVVTPIIAAQSGQETGAELTITPIGPTPLIQPNKQAMINLSFKDDIGFPYYKFDNPIGFIKTQIIWSIIHPKWRPFLGYSSITFSTSIVGNTPGWVASIFPTTIAKSTDGTKATLQLIVTVTNLTAENTATVRVTATRYSKDGSLYGTSDFDILVRSEKFNFLSIIPDVNSREVAPSAITTFTFSITNQGYFVDTFAVKANSSDSSILSVLSESSFVLNPDQTEQVTLWVMTPEKLFDPGTPHTINVSAYSIKYPTKYFSGAVTIVTKGVYISPLLIFYAILVIIIIIIFYFLFFYLRGRREKTVYGKPEKPWKLAEEQAHLQELKRTDKKAYDQERQMMDDEYKSAMLYYQDYRQSLKAKPMDEAPPPKEEKPKRQLPKLLKKSEKPEKPPKIEENKVEAIVPAEDKAKQRALAKIQKEQEKALKRKRE